MKNTVNCFCLTMILLGLVAHNALCQPYGWIPLGASDIDKPSPSTAYGHAMATFQNEPYIVYLDGSTNSVIVRRHTVKGWQTISNKDFAPASSTNNEIAIDHSGNVYVACNKKDFGYTSVQKWDGSSWTIIGQPTFISAGPIQYQNIAVSSAGIPYVAYLDTALGNALVVKKWDGIDWVDVGAGGIVDSLGIRELDLAIDYAGNPVVAYGSKASGFKVMVRKWNGTAWITLGNPDFSLAHFAASL